MDQVDKAPQEAFSVEMAVGREQEELEACFQEIMDKAPREVATKTQVGDHLVEEAMDREGEVQEEVMGQEVVVQEEAHPAQEEEGHLVQEVADQEEGVEDPLAPQEVLA